MKKVVKKKTVKKSTERPVLQEGNFSCQSDGLSGNRVFVSVSKTINIGNYESIRVEYGQGKTLLKGDIYDIARDELVEEVCEAIVGVIKQVEEELT